MTNQLTGMIFIKPLVLASFCLTGFHELVIFNIFAGPRTDTHVPCTVGSNERTLLKHMHFRFHEVTLMFCDCGCNERTLLKHMHFRFHEVTLKFCVGRNECALSLKKRKNFGVSRTGTQIPHQLLCAHSFKTQTIWLSLSDTLVCVCTLLALSCYFRFKTIDTHSDTLITVQRIICLLIKIQTLLLG